MTAYPVVLIDGRAGSGKTTLAAHLRDELQSRVDRVEVIHMDDLTPGWSGLATASDAVAQLLAKRAQQEEATWQRFDWFAEQLSETVTVPPDAWLIVEGCGSLSRASAPFASLRVWLSCNDELRRSRALQRDGALFAKHWDLWSTQEQDHIAREQPELLADVVCKGDARDTLRGCFRLLSSSLDQAATFSQFSKPANGVNSTQG